MSPAPFSAGSSSSQDQIKESSPTISPCRWRRHRRINDGQRETSLQIADQETATAMLFLPAPDWEAEKTRCIGRKHLRARVRPPDLEVYNRPDVAVSVGRSSYRRFVSQPGLFYWGTLFFFCDRKIKYSNKYFRLYNFLLSKVLFDFFFLIIVSNFSSNNSNVETFFWKHKKQQNVFGFLETYTIICLLKKILRWKKKTFSLLFLAIGNYLA